MEGSPEPAKQQQDITDGEVVTAAQALLFTEHATTPVEDETAAERNQSQGRAQLTTAEKLHWLNKIKEGHAVKATARELAAAAGLTDQGALSNLKRWRKQEDALQAEGASSGEPRKRIRTSRARSKSEAAVPSELLSTLLTDAVPIPPPPAPMPIDSSIVPPPPNLPIPGDLWSATEQIFSSAGCEGATKVLQQARHLQAMSFEHALVLALCTVPERGDLLADTARGLMQCNYSGWDTIAALQDVLPNSESPAPVQLVPAEPAHLPADVTQLPITSPHVQPEVQQSTDQQLQQAAVSAATVQDLLGAAALAGDPSMSEAAAEQAAQTILNLLIGNMSAVQADHTAATDVSTTAPSAPSIAPPAASDLLVTDAVPSAASHGVYDPTSSGQVNIADTTNPMALTPATAAATINAGQGSMPPVSVYVPPEIKAAIQVVLATAGQSAPSAVTPLPASSKDTDATQPRARPASAPPRSFPQPPVPVIDKEPLAVLQAKAAEVGGVVVECAGRMFGVMVPSTLKIWILNENGAWQAISGTEMERKAGQGASKKWKHSIHVLDENGVVTWCSGTWLTRNGFLLRHKDKSALGGATRGPPQTTPKLIAPPQVDTPASHDALQQLVPQAMPEPPMQPPLDAQPLTDQAVAASADQQQTGLLLPGSQMQLPLSLLQEHTLVQALASELALAQSLPQLTPDMQVSAAQAQVQQPQVLQPDQLLQSSHPLLLLQQGLQQQLQQQLQQGLHQQLQQGVQQQLQQQGFPPELLQLLQMDPRILQQLQQQPIVASAPAAQ